MAPLQLQQRWSRKALIVRGSSVSANAHLFSFCRTFYLGVCYLHQTLAGPALCLSVCPSNCANRHRGRPWLAGRAPPSHAAAAAASNFLHLPHIKAPARRRAGSQPAYLRVSLRVVLCCCCCCWWWWWRIACTSTCPHHSMPAAARRWDLPTAATASADPMFN